MSTEAIAIQQHASNEARQLHDAVERHVSDEARSVEIHVTSEISQASWRLSRALQASQANMALTTRRTRLLQSLKYHGMNERANMLTDAHIQTFHWIFKSDSGQSWDNFPEWLKSNSKIYWISGKPGSGKSTLVKFILSRPETKAALEVWDAGTAIFRHFLWKPGSRMQKGVKGLLASVLHQAFEREEQALDRALRSNYALGSKDSESDWSMSELATLCLSTLESYPSSVCIFVDGLDEVADEDGADALFQILDSWKNISKVKLCVASRPEPRFHRRLHRYQHLRLQDLTANDMQTLADEASQPVIAIYESNTPGAGFRVSYLFRLLLDRAEGVFLWLKLALAALRRGAENGDSIAELHTRLESLPNDLFGLYRDMWSRLNEDEPLYRQAAARYFNLLATMRNFTSLESKHGSSVLGLMAATNRDVQLHCLGRDDESLLNLDFERLLDRFSVDIQVRCAGILEISSSSSTPEDSALHKCATSQVRFIHRSAHDFIFDTEAGQQIRTADLSTESDRQICVVKANLAVVRALTGAGVRLRHRHSEMDEILRALAVIVTEQQGVEGYEKRFQAEILDILEVCQVWYERDYWGDGNPRPHFFARLAPYDQFHEYMVSKIRESPCVPGIATSVLRDLAWEWEYEWRNDWMYQSLKRSVSALLELQADPNAMGLLSLSERSLGLTKTRARPYGSAMMGILALYYHSRDRSAVPNFLDILQSLLDHGAALNALTCLTVEFDRALHFTWSYRGLQDFDSMQLGTFLIDSDSDLPKTEDFSIVLVVNLAYLVGRVITYARRYQRGPGASTTDAGTCNFRIGRVEPYVEARYLLLCGGKPETRRFRIKKTRISQAVERILHADFYDQPLAEGECGRGDIPRLLVQLVLFGCEEIVEKVGIELARDRIGFILENEYRREQRLKSSR